MLDSLRTVRVQDRMLCSSHKKRRSWVMKERKEWIPDVPSKGHQIWKATSSGQEWRGRHREGVGRLKGSRSNCRTGAPLLCENILVEKIRLMEAHLA